MNERAWVLTKVAKGDYLLPSNDASILWRISSYLEDGSATWGDTDRKIVGTYWNLHYYVGPEPKPDDWLDIWRDEHWRLWEHLIHSRNDAIAESLRAKPKR